ncbi:MAG: tryptophan-rich sensory protein [Verrucomicrobia bacterium]|nr:tryptophan-rich sensory protein [Verrucomicrobiota bacterium]
MGYPKKTSGFLQKFIPSLILCLGGGWLMGLLTGHGIKQWYPHLIKPIFTPPNFVFPIIWTVLYSMMAVALALLWQSKTAKKKRAFLCFGVQLFLNFIWSFLFFYLESPGIAFFDIVLLWIFIVLTIGAMWRHTHWGSYLLLPYLAWVSYAVYINFFIWSNN